MGHGDRRHLVRDGHRARQRLARREALGVRLDERREVGPRVGEEVFHAAAREQLQVGLGGRLDRDLLAHEGLSTKRGRATGMTGILPYGRQKVA